METLNKENLNKENFWDAIYRKYPDACGKFCDWIDEYKLRNNWDALFAPGVKFHDLPLAMQMGIFSEFANPQPQTQSAYFPVLPSDVQQAKAVVDDFFRIGQYYFKLKANNQ